MKLRAQFIFVILCTLLIMLPVLFIISWFILSEGFEQLEQREIEKDVQRTLVLIRKNVGDMGAKTLDWASRDEAYQFLQTGNQDFIEAEMSEAGMKNAHFNFIYFLNDAGRIVYSHAVDFDDDREATPPKSLTEELAKEREGGSQHLELLERRERNEGFLLLPEGLAIVVARQIRGPSGDPKGTLVAGCYWNARRTEELSDLAQMKTLIHLMAEPGMGPDTRSALKTLVETPNVVVSTPAPNRHISGFSLIHDMTGQPVAMLEVNGPRVSYDQGVRSVEQLIVSIILMAIIFSLVTGIAINQWVLKRLSRLSTEVYRIIESRSLETRVTVPSRDELGQLAQQINSLLETVARSEARMREREEEARKLALVAAQTRNQVIITNAQNQIEWVNDAFLDHTGYTLAELIGKGPGELLHGPETDPETAAKIVEKVSRGEGIRTEIINYTKDRTPYWGEVEIRPVHDAQGKVINYISVESDITERRQTQEKLRLLQERFELAVQGSSTGIWDWNLKTNIVYFSPQWKKQLGYEESEIGNDFSEWSRRLHPEDINRMNFFQGSYLDDDVPQEFEMEHRLLHKDGNYRWILTRGVGQYDAEGHMIRLTGTNLDISKLKFAEEALRYNEQVLDGVAQVSHLLLSQPNVAQAIKESLKTLGQVSGVSRVYLFTNHQDAATHEPFCSLRYWWSENDDLPAIDPAKLQNLSYDHMFSRWYDELASGNPVSGLIRGFPEDEYEFLKQLGTVSLLLAPIMIEGRFWGFVGFDDCMRERDWTVNEADTLGTAVSGIAAAILRERAERSVRATSSRLEALVTNLQAGVMVEDPEGKIALVNRMFCVLTNQSAAPEEMIGKRGADEIKRMAPIFADPESAIDRVNQIIETGELVIQEEVRLADGRFMERDFVPIRRGGEYLGHLWEYRDITERKLAQERLTRIARLQELVGHVIASFLEKNNLDESIHLILGEVGEFLNVSRVYLFRYRSGQLLHNTHEWCAPEAFPRKHLLQNLDASQFEDWNAQLQSGELVKSSDVANDPHLAPAIKRMTMSQGAKAILVLPVLIHGRLEGFIGFDDIRSTRVWVDEDITLLQTMVQSYSRAVERRVAEREREAAAEKLHEALDKAETANRYKSEFLASMSHEIRTPMTAIVGYADLILRPRQKPQDYMQWGRQIRQNAEFLLGLINDILDLSKIEAGQLTVRPEPCVPTEIVESVYSFLQPAAQEKVLQFKVVYDTKLPRSIETDPLRFRQILLNLSNNAIKFTDNGSVTIRVGFAPGMDKIGILTIRIEDTGIGIAPEKVSTLFSAFTQVHTSNYRRYGGTGLGLAISRRLARMLDGDIAVSSMLGEGSQFTLSLAVKDFNPDNLVEAAELLAPQKPQLDEITDRTRLDGANILIVDDNPDNQRIIQFLVEEVGALTTITHNGELAVQAVEDAAKGPKPFDIVLMDMQMPVLDGYGATRKLRSLGNKTPIIALTAFAMSTDQDLCMQAGCDGYLSKPIIPDVLLKTIRKMLPASAVDRKRKPPTITSTLAKNAKFLPLLRGYVKTMPETIRQINDAWNRGDIESLKMLTHRLKGSGGSYGFAMITEIATSCEGHLRASHPLEALKPEILRLIDVLNAAAESLPEPPSEKSTSTTV